MCVKVQWVTEESEIQTTNHRHTSSRPQPVYLVTLSSLPPLSVESLRFTDTFTSAVTGRNSAHNFFLRCVDFHSLRSFISSTVFISCVPVTRRRCSSPSLSVERRLETHSRLHSTDSSHFPLKGRLWDQISPGVRHPPCAGAAQDIALRPLWVFPLRCKHRQKEKVCCLGSSDIDITKKKRIKPDLKAETEKWNRCLSCSLSHLSSISMTHWIPLGAMVAYGAIVWFIWANSCLMKSLYKLGPKHPAPIIPTSLC